MIKASNKFAEAIASPVRQTKARVELYDGSTLVDTFAYTDALKEFTIDKISSEKFFGFGVCARLNVKLINMNANTNSISTKNTLDIAMGVDNDYLYCYPPFFVTEVHRNEITNELSVTAYDSIYKANKLTAADVKIEAPYTIRQYLYAAAGLLGMPIKFVGDIPELNLYYEDGANLEGTESLRSVLDTIAEVTGTIYFQSNDWCLTFLRLDKDAEPAFELNKDNYINLESKTNRRLGAIAHITELGDNVIAEMAQSGTTQYLRDNPWLNLRNDIGNILDGLLDALGGLTLNQYECEWRGNYLAEIGDRVAIKNYSNDTVYSYLLNTSVYYNGFLSEKSEWSFIEEDDEFYSQPTNATDVLNQTYARVDKLNNRIDLVASDTDHISSQMSALVLQSGSINATVEQMQSNLDATVGSLTSNMNNLTQRVNMGMTPEDVNIAIEQTLSNGVDTITTSTGYTFDSEGLTITKTGSEMSTQITEDGMTVSRGNTPLLVADHIGVEATNLYAKTFLIIGINSRFEDYNNNTRTGCFWIGE